MKAAVFQGPERMEIKEVDTPQCKEAEVLLKVEACAVCGTDARIYYHGQRNVVPPHIIGHEIAGTICETGKGANGYKKGGKVTGLYVFKHISASLVRCILESLAFAYRLTLERLEEVLGDSIEVLHIVGGGARNKLLCQFTANAIERPVIAGLVEATAAGNLIMQAVATGELSSIEEARNLIKNSFEVTAYQPANTASWKQAYSRFKDILEKKGDRRNG